MRFSEALENGSTEYGKPERVVITFVSKLFFFGEKVFKVYKHEDFFFADLLSFETRKEFYREDFFYNNTAAPEIYLHLWGIKEVEGSFTFVPPTFGEDFTIEMSTIDDSQTLTHLLIAERLNSEDPTLLVDALIDTLTTLTRERRTQLEHLFSKGLYQIMREDIESLHTWMYGAQPHISKEQTDSLSALLLEAIEKESYFKNASIDSLTVAIDNNSDNLLLLNGKPSFIDIMPPMVIWRVADQYATISRTIVDCEILGNTKLGRMLMRHMRNATLKKSLKLHAWCTKSALQQYNGRIGMHSSKMILLKNMECLQKKKWQSLRCS